MPERNRNFLSTFAALTSVFAVLLVAIVAAVGKGAPADSALTTATAKPVKVTLSEYAITPSTVSVAAGGSIDVLNTGSMAHNLSIVDQNVKTADVIAGGKANLDLPASLQARISSTAR